MLTGITLLSIPGVMTETACEHEDMRISCPAGSVISVINGFFGRTTRRICDRWYGFIWNLNCVSEMAPGISRNLCDGQNSCDVPTTTGYYGDPCWLTEKYVQITYECLCKYWYVYVCLGSR